MTCADIVRGALTLGWIGLIAVSSLSAASPESEAVLAHVEAFKAQAASNETLAEMRAHIANFTAVDPSARELPSGVEVIPVSADGVTAEWLVPAAADPGSRLLYLHGGGWIMGGLESHRPLASRLAEAGGCAVLLIDYRLAPEHPFPAALEDARTAYMWMRTHGPHREQIAESLFIAGDSAGGNLTLALLPDLRVFFLRARLRIPGPTMPNAAVALSPVTDFTLSSPSYAGNADSDPLVSRESIGAVTGMYLQGADPSHPLVSPLSADLSGLPPLLIHVSGSEVLRGDATRFAQRAWEAGNAVTLVLVPDMVHVWHAFAPFLPEANEALAQIGHFLRAKR